MLVRRAGSQIHAGFDPLTDCVVVMTIAFGRLQYKLWRGKACFSPFTEPVERPLQDSRQLGNKAISQPFVLLSRRDCCGKLDYPNSPPNGFSRPGDLWEIVGCQPQFELWVELKSSGIKPCKQFGPLPSST